MSVKNNQAQKADTNKEAGIRILLQSDLSRTHIHFTGIKGTGMAALVELCRYRGARISGSDVADRFYTDEVLERLGIKPALFSSDNIGRDIDLLVRANTFLSVSI